MSDPTPTLVHATKLIEVADALRVAIEQGDADKAIEGAAWASGLCTRILDDYEVVVPTYVGADDLLERARRTVAGRRATYGEVGGGLDMVAQLWSVLLGRPISAVDVAAMMAALKIARLHQCPDHVDSWVDLAGYAACGAEVATVGRKVA